MCTKSQLEAIEEEMVNYYRSVYGDSIDTIILYGSYARGDYSDDSDIDITAIVRGNRVELQKKLKKMWDFSTEVGLAYDVIVSGKNMGYWSRRVPVWIAEETTTLCVTMKIKMMTGGY